MRSLFLIIFTVVLSLELASAVPSIKASEVVKALSTKNIQALHKKNQERFKTFASKVKLPISADGIRTLERSLDWYDFIRMVEYVDSPEFYPLYKWLAANYPQMSVLVKNLSSEDDGNEVVRIVDELCSFDRAQRKQLFPLITAMALVWDQPRGMMHGQMGRKTLSYRDQKITDVYNYFKQLFLSKKCAVKIDKLSVGELIFVVDTPVPISELEWALDNERGNASSWGKKYGRIEYDTPRLDANEMSWPSYNGSYSLANIKEHGGICVDQAYYSVMTARAHGIPAMYFGGKGRRGGHAWFGHFVKEGEWITDVGQYSGDNYAVGHTKNPQTNRRMTDHDVEFACQRKLRRKDYRTAMVYARAAELLLHLDKKGSAYRFANIAVETAPLCLDGWSIKELLLLEANKKKTLLSLYQRKQDVFKKYPDVAAETKLAYARLLDETGRSAEAAKLRKEASKKLGKDRTDINVTASLEQFEALAKKRKRSEAIKVLETLIWDNKEERAIVFGAMARYLDYTKENGMASQAVKFIKKVYSKMERDASQLEIGGLMGLMIQAYENASDKKGAQKIRKELAELEDDKKKRTRKNRKRDKRRQQEDDDFYERN